MPLNKSLSYLIYGQSEWNVSEQQKTLMVPKLLESQGDFSLLERLDSFQQVLVKGLLWVRHCDKPWGLHEEGRVELPAPMELIL